MIRKIVDYQKLNDNLLNLLIEKFPEGYDDDDIITFRNANGQVIEAVEIRTNDTIYLVKVGIKLTKIMEEFSDEEEDLDDESEEVGQMDVDDLEEGRMED